MMVEEVEEGEEMIGASGVLSSSGIDRAAGVSSGLRACDGGGYIGGGI